MIHAIRRSLGPLACAAAAFVFFLLSGAAAAEPSTTPIAIKPSAAIVRYAAKQGIPLEGFELAGADEPARPGDLLVVLFTIQEGAIARQWLGEFRFAALTERETRSKPGTGLGILGAFQSTLYSDTEHAFSFPQIPVALELRTHGPFTGEAPEAAPPKAVSTRVLATRDYLVHGLAPMGEIELRLRAAGKKNPGLSFMFRSKYSAEQIAASKARARAAGFSEEDERAYAKSIFALVQFGNLSFLTKGPDAITREVADSPTLFSGAFTNPDWNNLQMVDGTEWGFPGDSIFRVPYNFFSKTKAKGHFYLMNSRPPLQNLAGIIGLTVDETSKAPGKRLVMRVLAGRRAPPP